MGFLIEIAPELVILAFGVLMAALQAKITSDAFAGFWNNLTPLAKLVLIGPVKLSRFLAQHLTHNLGQHWKQLEGTAVTWLSAWYQWAALPVTMAMSWPLYLVRLQLWLLDVAIPDAIRFALRGVHGTVRVVTKTLPAIERTIIKFPKLSKAQAKALIAAAVATFVHPYLAELRWIKSHFHAMTAVIPHALPVPRGWTPTAIRRWVRKAIRADYATLAFAGAVAFAISRLGIGWVRCGNVKRVGKALCGLGPRALEDLLGLIADVLILRNICTVITLMEDGFNLIEPAITGFIKTAEKQFIHCGYDLPTIPAITLPYLPPVTGVVLNKAA